MKILDGIYFPDQMKHMVAIVAVENEVISKKYVPGWTIIPLLPGIPFFKF